ncbi:hypothetical protein [Streptomyces sp. SID12501]|uniref:Uncharacterized protein n=1 Tax=Streptomyces sp. SID12501 TaxID=2706042 RepID=A0A6B3BUJ1_9ACTN|nr:hypothetical protein [Streptomyces sp. SID12501]NEC87989.1 hypothetical protein [Streptomyces sp. SID12501]
MKYVRVEPLPDRYGYYLDPQGYLDVLPDISGSLPDGVAEFVADPGHYDFRSARCVKDLTLNKMTLTDGEGLIALEVFLEPNEWKHVGGLRIRYSDVRALDVSTKESDGMLARLGSLQLDEVLPHPSGFSHEIAFTCGSVAIVAADLVAAWE